MSAENDKKALHRLRSFWWEEPVLISALGERIKVVCGDITLDDLGIAEETAGELASSVSCVIHTAAETGVQNARSRLQEINTAGTLNVVSFAKRIQRDGHLERFIQISTAYVAGDREGRIMETDPLPNSFSTYYEESKADAEKIVRLGIRKGSKVALTGNNCTNYFALDIAIGLVGAVSVPIYYTTPVAEVDILLQKSGAGWLFVGDRRIMKQIDDLKSDVTLISFSNAQEIKPQKRTAMTWRKFLGTKEQRKNAMLPDVLVDPGDLATIRYTSGTTGELKGVMFNAGQLAWMGRVLTDLLPWREKQNEMRYLSFLPLSHVVEGILASYAPYYMHCPVKFYYLNDFDKLTEALPKVRPTVFFSVPRFYEKLWQQIEANPAGQRYLAMEEGPAKTVLGNIVRRTVLKKAGLDNCSQLIVGSAPISEELLLKFRRLGIEIHNAYGQTEAPLITINRLGDNVIPSIGTPLPDTEVTARPDGELIVKGPQVCLGYYGLETENIKDGGMLPLTPQTAPSMHDPSLPDNLYVADATILPRSAGMPPILTVMAMALHVAQVIREN